MNLYDRPFDREILLNFVIEKISLKIHMQSFSSRNYNNKLYNITII